MQYAYDYRGRMTEVSLPNTQTYTYRYDNTYNRVQKIFADGLVRNYIGELAEAETRNGGITYLNFHFFAQGVRVATTGTNGLHYNTHDHLGSTTAITSKAGVIEQKLDYLPFGAERVNQKTTAFDSHFTYTDQEKDAESGLLYYGARYYDPVIGRFTQMDPVVKDPTRKEFQVALANPQLLNGYSYVANNPIKSIDKEGEFVVLAAIAVGVGVAALLGSSYFYGSGLYNLSQGNQAKADQMFRNNYYVLGGAAVVGGGILGLSAMPVLSGVSGISAGTACAGGGCQKVANTATELSQEAQQFLNKGPATSHVYLGIKDQVQRYVGITNDLARRFAEHGERFVDLRSVATDLTRGQARAIEQALIEYLPNLENIRNSISPNQPYYQEAVKWGTEWLKINTQIIK